MKGIAIASAVWLLLWYVCDGPPVRNWLMRWLTAIELRRALTLGKQRCR